MARPILGPQGSRKESRADCGGVKLADRRDVMNYKPPKGPTNINDPRGVSLHGNAPTKCGTQGPQSGPKGGSSGAAGITRLGGENLGNCGTQGKR